MKLLAVSTGTVQTITIDGEALQTAHVKSTISPPWHITPDGVEGDQRAVHPDKLYAFARTGYAYWAEKLGIDRTQWSDGYFGENLTLDTLDEEDVRIGDVFALGDEVRLIVTGARTPCLKLSWRLKQPRTFQRIFAASRNTGMYLGVLIPGTVRPGDSLVRIHHDAGMPSVAAVCDLVLDRHPKTPAPLRQLLAFDRLSPTLRFILTAKLDAAARAAGESEQRWRGWCGFVIERIVAETADVRSLYLRPLDGRPLARARPGQFVTVRLRTDTGEELQRAWSLSALITASDSHYRITVRRQSGPASQWIHSAVPGSIVHLRAPAGQFTLDAGSYRPAVLIAAGIGITPLMAMLQAHLARSAAPQVRLIYCVRSPAEVVFRAELEALAAAHPTLRVIQVCSQATADGSSPGRLTPDALTEHLSDLYLEMGGQRLPLPWYEADLYLCGPEAFCAEFKQALVTRGANADRVYSETFTAAPVIRSGLDVADVRFERTGVTVTWTADEDLSLLELAERAGIEVDNDCRAGACLSCRTRVTSGSTTADLGDGAALLCLGRPATPKLVLER